MAIAQPDDEMNALLAPVHDATRQFVSQPIGRAVDNMFSYLALVQDDQQYRSLTKRNVCMQKMW